MKIFFIVNERSSSGNAKKLWKKIKTRLDDENVEYQFFISERKGHSIEIARKLTLELSEKVILAVIGGDGTVNEAINGVQDFENVVLAPIKAGSGNDFCRNVYENNGIDARLDSILNFDGNFKSIDIGEIDFEIDGESKKRLFAVSSGFGIDAEICKRVNESRLKAVLNKIKLGSLAFLIVTIKSVVKMKTFKISAKTDSGEFSVDNAVFQAVMNLQSEGGGVYMRPDANAGDGILSSLSFAFKNVKNTFENLPKLLKRRHLENSDFLLNDFQSAEISLDTKVVFHCDGEFIGNLDKASYKCRKLMLKVV